jgi:hypothetical protein
MASGSVWSRQQLLVAFDLYCRLPFGKLHHRNPEIIRWANLIGRTPSALAMKLTNIASLDPKITESGRRGLRGASSADRAMWDEMNADWSSFASASRQAREAIGDPELVSTEDDVSGPVRPLLPDDMPAMPASFAGDSRRIESFARIGQSFFRRCVLSAYSSKCCITGLSIPSLLIASHISPWKSDPNNRLNPRNGLCLSALHDKAFDLGLIHLTDNFEVRLTKRSLVRSDDSFAQSGLSAFEGRQIDLPDKFAPDVEFIRKHREISKARYL